MIKGIRGHSLSIMRLSSTLGVIKSKKTMRASTVFEWSPHTMYKCNIQRMNPYYLYLCHRWFNILDYWHVNVIFISYNHANPAYMSNSTSFAHWWNVITETDNSKCKYIRNKISFLGGVYEDIITFHILVACKVCGKLLQIEHINTGRVLEFHYYVTNAERC